MTTLAPLDTISEYELAWGKPMPSINHGSVQANLIVAIAQRYPSQYRIVGELTLDLDPSATPDICIYPKIDLDWMRDQIKMAELPLLAIEIQSPIQGPQELLDKIDRYLNAGVKSCWLVQPAFKSVAIYSLGTEPRLFTEGEVIDPVVNIQVALDAIFH